MRDVRSLLIVNVLIVDPWADDRERIRRYLADDDQYSYEVMQAESGDEGLVYCAQKLPDLILMNSSLPDMTALTFLQQLQQDSQSSLQPHSQPYSRFHHQPYSHQRLPIVLLAESPSQTEGTAQALLHSTIAAFKQGVADCLIKSEMTAETLRSTVHQILSAFRVKQNVEQHAFSPKALQQANQALQQQITEQATVLAQVKQQLQQERADRQRAEALLSQSEAEFRVLSEAAPIGIFRIDRQGNCTYVNPRAQVICGYTLEEAMGIGWQRSIHPDEREQQWSKWVAAMLAKREYADEIRYVHKDGTVRFARVRTAPIVSAGEIAGHVGTIEDITEAQETEQIKREFLSIVSHELKTPLASIRGALALLSTGLFDDEPDTGQEVLEIAISDTERLVRLVNDLLDLERLESRQITLIRQWCNAATLMQRSVDSLQPLAEKEQIFLTFTPLPQQIYADPDRIIQILVNLLGNAIKFSSPNQQVHLSAALVTVAAQSPGRTSAGEPMIRFQVRDHGRGIPADKLTLIFERFQQVQPTDTRQQDGTGLGLAICRNLVQLHGGQIWVESTMGQGSTFYFTLPLNPGNAGGEL